MPTLSKSLVSRRTFLRGVGVSMALPWMESLPAWSAENRRDGQPPVRFACVFAGNGFQSGEWWARGEGREMQFGKVLESLTPFREKLNFIRQAEKHEKLLVQAKEHIGAEKPGVAAELLRKKVIRSRLVTP